MAQSAAIQEILSASEEPGLHLVQHGPAAFLATLAEYFGRAARAVGFTIDRDYLIAGRRVRIRFAGPTLEPVMTPAFDHLAVPTADPAEFTICVWDGATTGVPLPALPWSPGDYLSHGEVRGYSTERFRVSVNTGLGQLNASDLERGVAFHAIVDPALEPFPERGSPLLRPLHWWLERRGRQVLHAAAVGTPSGGVLLAGKSGTGKSTTALACLASGLDYLSDDYCLLATEPEPRVFSLYNSGKVNLENERRFPDLKPAARSEEKALFYLAQLRPEKIAASFEVRAVLMPQVGRHPQTRAVPVSPMIALAALAPSTIFQLSRRGETAFRMIGRLVKRVPCFRLDLSEDIAAIPPVIAKLLNELNAAPESRP